MDEATRTTHAKLDPVTLVVLGNRMEDIAREMTDALLKTARSSQIAIARDFSCGVVSSENELLATGEGVPIHVLGMELQAATMTDEVRDFREGDAFLHNDSYRGNSHQADHTIMVPVFWEGEHVFTACAKAHQADCGNALPTTYMPAAKDIYEEGALTFPCVHIQRDYKDVSDIVRMCMARIRVPEVWYGDYLAALGAARTAERSLHALCKKHGLHTIRQFVREWLEYGERRMAAAIRELPEAEELIGRSRHDPFPGVPDGVSLEVKIRVRPDEAMIDVDLTNNPDCLPNGLNLTEATSRASAMIGVFNCLDPDIPHNSGSMRRVNIELREGCCVGVPVRPYSCSIATSNLTEHVANAIQVAFAGLGEGYGMAEGAVGQGAILAVVSGKDSRKGGADYVIQLLQGAAGGPGNPYCDGWLTYWLPVAAGLFYKDSIEISEQKYPLYFDKLELLPDSAGPGYHRGAPGVELIYRAKGDPVTALFFIDGHERPPIGVHGGGPGAPTSTWSIDADGKKEELPTVVSIVLNPGEGVVSVTNGGGGYGNPLERPAEWVLKDAIEGWITIEGARRDYGVELVKSEDAVPLKVDEEATRKIRTRLAADRRVKTDNVTS